MEELKYPGFAPEQIAYLLRMFPSPIVTPEKPHDDLMFQGGQHSVVLHIKAREERT
ncbi:hypothetical protein [Geobacter sp. SVR]|uniref:hypothetical protein n=1 Tax=Geobacter sp. SVR TaxID=2495594 RepID=UPI00143EF78A|nr:hypothetical protein [Geobacter sp. SVR]BCS53314.1 hypothetical protein GSVR_16220 [Geobacter sp. SVR]GCF85560.1 hypothetical protein GSbR_21600 [Geobacter sp. SVR]